MYRVDVYFKEGISPEAWKGLPRVLGGIVKRYQVECSFATIYLPDEVMRGEGRTLHEYLVQVRSKLAEKGYRVREFGNVEKIWDIPREPSKGSVC